MLFRSDDCCLRAGGQIGARLLADVAPELALLDHHGGLETGEREVEVAAVQQRPWQREGRQVSVQAQSQTSEDKQDGEQIKERIIYRERTATRYSRSFTLPLEVDQAGTVAKLEHGVLTLTLPKRSALSAAQITVN